jgi:hypothetical protein
MKIRPYNPPPSAANIAKALAATAGRTPIPFAAAVNAPEYHANENDGASATTPDSKPADAGRCVGPGR